MEPEVQLCLVVSSVLNYSAHTSKGQRGSNNSRNKFYSPNEAPWNGSVKLARNFLSFFFCLYQVYHAVIFPLRSSLYSLQSYILSTHVLYHKAITYILYLHDVTCLYTFFRMLAPE